MIWSSEITIQQIVKFDLKTIHLNFKVIRIYFSEISKKKKESKNSVQQILEFDIKTEHSIAHHGEALPY